MPPRKELCRNFQRGSCRYGDRCKFLHATRQQQSKPNNPFGFGMQNGSQFQNTNQQQQVPNPFGVRAQNTSNQFKPFENKWTRSSTNSTASRQPEKQASPADHMCTDPEACRRVVLEDFETEKPLWKLSCYGHSRNGPCDISGDISCEELRALAYDAAKSGASLQSIIERERSLVNSKLVEYQNLVQKPHAMSSNVTSQSPFPGTTPNAFGNNNHGVSPQMSSFSQLNASLNTPPAASPNYTFGQSSTQPLNASLNTRSTAAPSYAFGLTSPQPPNMFQMNQSHPSPSGAFGSRVPPHQPVQSGFSFGSASAHNSAVTTNKNLFSNFGNSSQMGNTVDDNYNTAASAHDSASNAIGESSIHDNLPIDINNVDESIYRKENWKFGEIPERVPPTNFIV